MAQTRDMVVDWERYAQARERLGGNFWRVMGYLREDGHKSVTMIEEALRADDAVALIGPAELLKSEALQMGALAVAEIAEEIELQARDCVEWHQSPEMLVSDVVRLRQTFEETVDLFEKEASPLLTRKPDFRRNLEFATR